MNTILSASEFVVNHAQSVSIDYEMLRLIAAQYQNSQHTHWLRNTPFDVSSLNEEQIANFFLLYCSLIFCFWGEPKWTVVYEGKSYDGSYGLLAALRKSLEQGCPIFDWSYWQHSSREQFAEMLAGNVEIPLFEERWNIVKDIGTVMTERWQGQMSTLIQANGKDASSLLSLISDEFPSFRDVSYYQGKEIPFYKRAQLLVIDIYHFFEGKGLGDLTHIDTITSLADYKVPQILRYLGIIKYVTDLAHDIDAKVEIVHDSLPEIEIRAAQVWSVELMRRIIAERIPTVTCSEINDYLWEQSQTAQGMKPYHRSKNIYY